MIYLITCREQGICKIGFTTNIKRRQSQIQHVSAHKIVVEYSIEGDLKRERFIHGLFAKYRLEREWFKLVPEIEKYFISFQTVKLIDVNEIKPAQRVPSKLVFIPITKAQQDRINELAAINWPSGVVAQ